MAQGWQKDGSGLLVYRCRGKTFNPKISVSPGWSYMERRGRHLKRRHVSWFENNKRHCFVGGPAECAKNPNSICDSNQKLLRKGVRRLLHLQGKTPCKPQKLDKRYHLRKTFVGEKYWKSKSIL